MCFAIEPDKTFTTKASGFMGTMSFDTFKTIVDQAEGNIEFMSLAWRGEPLVCERNLDECWPTRADVFIT